MTSSESFIKKKYADRKIYYEQADMVIEDEQYNIRSIHRKSISCIKVF